MIFLADNSHIMISNSSDSSKILQYLINILLLFILVAFSSSLFFGIFQSIRKTSFDGFIDGIMFGALLTLSTVPILVLLDIIQKIKYYFRYKTIDFGVNQEKRFLMNADYNVVFSLIASALSNINNIDICQKDMEYGIIKASVKGSWKSFGENIDVRLHKSSTNKVVVVLSSRPKIPITMMDYSKNFENIETIMRCLETAVHE